MNNKGSARSGVVVYLGFFCKTKSVSYTLHINSTFRLSFCSVNVVTEVQNQKGDVFCQ